MGTLTDSLFRRFVAVGDSLSQGTWNVGTAADSQAWGLPAVLARQARAEFRLPLLAEPGEPPQIWPPSRLIGQSLSREGWGERLDPALEIDNFAVPGARLGDVVELTPGGLDTAHRPTQFKSLVRRVLNPLHRPDLEHLTQVDRAIAAQPSLVHVLAGANDILENFFHLSYDVTPPVVYARQWRRLLQRLLSETDAPIVVVLVPMLVVAPAVQVHRRRARLLRRCEATIRAYNGIIAETAQRDDRVLVVDLNDGMLDAATDGIDVRGWDLPFKVRDDRLTLRPPVGVPGQLWSGGLLSYDGLHPTMTGYAMLANGIIEGVNERFGLEVPLCDLAAVAAADPLLRQPSPWLWVVSKTSQRFTFESAAARLDRASWPWAASA